MIRAFLAASFCLATATEVGSQTFSEPSPITGCERSRSDDTIISVLPQGEIGLESGRSIKLLDVRLSADRDDLKQPLAWLSSLVGRRVAINIIGNKPDRWGRLVADLILPDETTPIDVAGLLVAEGFALTDVGDRTFLCRPEFLLQEAQARSRRLGLWARDAYRPFAADDIARLRASIGRFALVEGRVYSIGERRDRTYLNFGTDWSNDFTVIIPKRTWAILSGRGWSAASLKGKHVRIRGVLEEWQGVAVEITAADMLEVLTEERRRRT